MHLYVLVSVFSGALSIVQLSKKEIRGAAHRDLNINDSLNYKNPIVFHNLKMYDTFYYART